MVPISDQKSAITVEVETVAGFLWEQADKKQCNLYAIVDSARNDEVFKYFLTDDITYRSLFQGKMDIKFFGVSGFLVECKKDSILFNWLTNDAWGTSCCVFLISKDPFEEILKHFQKFNRVYLEDDDVVYFRYYDPRVLRAYLPTCNEKEISIFFELLESVFLESDYPESITQFSKFSNGRLNVLNFLNHKIK